MGREVLKESILYCSATRLLTQDSPHVQLRVVVPYTKLSRKLNLLFFGPVRVVLHCLNLLFDVAKIQYTRYAQYTIERSRVMWNSEQ